jgi:hypothetical protein
MRDNLLGLALGGLGALAQHIEIVDNEVAPLLGDHAQIDEPVQGARVTVSRWRPSSAASSAQVDMLHDHGYAR